MIFFRCGVHSEGWRDPERHLLSRVVEAVPGFENAEKGCRAGNSYFSRLGGKGWGQVVETSEGNGQGLNRMVAQSPDWRGWNSKLTGSEVHSVGQEKVSQSLAAFI